jgi:hypothetical protein
MFEEYYAGHVIRDRERGRALTLGESRLGESRMIRRAHPGEERAVLSAAWRGWSWRRARGVLGTLGLALVASVAMPASLQAVAWGLREILGLLIR